MIRYKMNGMGGIIKDPKGEWVMVKDLKICTGCGHESWEPIKPPALGCCPDNNYIPVKDYVRQERKHAFEKAREKEIRLNKNTR